MSARFCVSKLICFSFTVKLLMGPERVHLPFEDNRLKKILVKI